MDKTIKEYLDRAAEIIGDRTSSEIAHDDAVVEALNQGHTIEEALSIAGEKHPGEALNQGRTIEEALSIAGEKHPGEAIKWDNGNIGDIAAHYEYLKEHTRIMRMLQKQRKR